MPKQTLTYSVTVDDADYEDVRQYLRKLREAFRIISEDLAAWGYSGDQTVSLSDIYVEQEDDDAEDSAD